jgi:hypothetical protein
LVTAQAVTNEQTPELLSEWSFDRPGQNLRDLACAVPGVLLVEDALKLFGSRSPGNHHKLLSKRVLETRAFIR